MKLEKLEKLNENKFQTLENTELGKAVGGSTNVHRTRGQTKLLGIIVLDTWRDRG
jgi:hypothetical protein